MAWLWHNKKGNIDLDNTSVNLTRVSAAIRNVLQLIKGNIGETEFIVREGLNEAEARLVWQELIKTHADCDFSFELRDGRTISASKFLTEQNIQHQKNRVEALGLNTLPLDPDIIDEIASYIYERLYEANLTGVYREISSQEVLIGIPGQESLINRQLLRDKITVALCKPEILDEVTNILNTQLRIAQEKQAETSRILYNK